MTPDEIRNQPAFNLQSKMWLEIGAQVCELKNAILELTRTVVKQQKNSAGVTESLQKSSEAVKDTVIKVTTQSK